MKIFLSIKYYDDMRNRSLIEQICTGLEKKGISTFVFARDIQNYEKCKLSPREIMETAFKQINNSDALLVDASELSIGVGIEVGYAYGKNIPIYLVAHKEAYVSNSVKGVAQKSLFYENACEVSNLF